MSCASHLRRRHWPRRTRGSFFCRRRCRGRVFARCRLRVGLRPGRPCRRHLVPSHVRLSRRAHVCQGRRRCCDCCSSCWCGHSRRPTSCPSSGRLGRPCVRGRLRQCLLARGAWRRQRLSCSDARGGASSLAGAAAIMSIVSVPAMWAVPVVVIGSASGTHTRGWRRGRRAPGAPQRLARHTRHRALTAIVCGVHGPGGGGGLWAAAGGTARQQGLILVAPNSQACVLACVCGGT